MEKRWRIGIIIFAIVFIFIGGRALYVLLSVLFKNLSVPPRFLIMHTMVAAFLIPAGIGLLKFKTWARR